MPEQTPTVVLLGAGASQEAGVPTTFEMTQALVERIDQHRNIADSISPALHFVCAALISHDAATQGQSPYIGLDVERVFAAVELLAERDTLEVTPFVSSWHPAVDAWDTRDRSTPPFFDQHLQRAIIESPSFGSAGKLITELIDSRTGSAADGETYRKLAGEMLAALRALVATTEKSVAYLSPLVQPARSRPITIATLNYDLSVEQVSVLEGVSCSTGVDSWLQTGRWSWPPAGVRLLKLHGSIDWTWGDAEELPGHLPQRRIFVTSEDDPPQGPPAIIFGQRGKLRAEGPFLSLLGELEAQMGEATRLVTIGYSFRDNHVNELIQRWLSEDGERTICVVDPAWPEWFPPGAPKDFRATLNRYLLPPDWRDTDFAPRLEVLRTRCSEALPTLL